MDACSIFSSLVIYTIPTLRYVLFKLYMILQIIFTVDEIPYVLKEPGEKRRVASENGAPQRQYQALVCSVKYSQPPVVAVNHLSLARTTSFSPLFCPYSRTFNIILSNYILRGQNNFIYIYF